MVLISEMLALFSVAEFGSKFRNRNTKYSKTVNGVETVYYWDGDVLVGERTGSNYTQYVYDAKEGGQYLWQ